MLTLPTDFESDSFASDLSLNSRHVDTNTPIEQFQTNFDIQDEKFKQISSNNKELINVQSQLARLRSELEKSEMLRQTLEYELTLLRTQHGKQNAFTNQLQNQFNQANQQIKYLQTQLDQLNFNHDKLIQDKDLQIKQLIQETQTLHERETRIEALNEQIQKMEKSFSDSESLSRKNLAQSILAKERENEFKKEFELIQIKLQYSEQALEQEKNISNEAKLNVQLLTSRLTDFESHYEQLKTNNSNQERKIDELQRQCSNEKLLRSTLSKLQSDFESKSDQIQKLTIDYEKQLKQIREELAHYRRKFRNNEEKYSQLVLKTFDLLRLTKIINENYQIEQNLPTLKQLEDLKSFIEQFKTLKIDQTNEINRLKKTIERLNKTTFNHKQLEQQTEFNLDKLQTQVEEIREKNTINEQHILKLKKEREQFIEDIQKKNSFIEFIQNKLTIFIGKTSSNIENDFEQLENLWKSIQNKSHSLEQKLLERDNGTLLLTQKLEQQVLAFKNDLELKHKHFIQQKELLLQKHQNEILQLNNQLQSMEKRAKEAEFKLNNSNQIDIQYEKFNLICKHLISIYIPLKKKYFQLIDSKRFLKNDFEKFYKIKQFIQLNSTTKKTNRFRIYVISIIAFKRFSLFKTYSTIQKIPSTNTFYDQSIIENFNQNLLQSIHFQDIFQSFIILFNKLSPIHQKGSLIKLLQGGFNNSNRNQTTIDSIESLINRFQEIQSKFQIKDVECLELRKTLTNIENENQSRIDYYQFERICDELQRALDREKQAQDLLNEQNNQLKSLTDILHQTQKEKDFIQEKFNQLIQNEKYSKEKIQQLTKTHQQMDDNVKRAEKAIRLVVSDKELISAFCTRINSALNVSEKRNLDNIEQLITQLDALVQLPNNCEQKKSPPEMVLCQTMAIGFVNLLNRLKELILITNRDIHSLKEHCQILTEQFRQISTEDISQIDSSQTVLVQAHPVRVQVNHHPQSAFKPIKPQLDEE